MKTKTRWKRILPVLCVALMLILGLGVMFYPLASNLVNQRSQTRVIGDYGAAVEQLGKSESKALLQAAREYNAAHPANYTDQFPEEGDALAYARQLSVNGNEIIGYLEIKKIGVSLAIYHGTGEAILSAGVGHLPRTSLPVGGPSTHAVLTGHTGLPSAELLTKLDQIEIGDRFLIHVLDETLTYEVDQIKVVMPNETGDLSIVPKEDYVTLVTCTPYGTNSHRLLVRAKAVDTGGKWAALLQEALRTFPWPVMLLLCIPMVLAVGLYTGLAYQREKKRTVFIARRIAGR